MVEITGSYPPVGSADIADVERQLGFAMPAALKAFYLEHNGGRPRPNLFPAHDDFFEVHIFLPIKSGNPKLGLERTYDLLVRQTSEFPRDFLPFASDQGGDHFMVSLRPVDEGAVFFNQSDYYDDPDRFVVFLAPTLQAFLDGLTDGD